MKRILHYLIAFLVIPVLVGCMDHRDLHVVSSPLLLVKNDWTPSRTNVGRQKDNAATYTDPMATLLVYPLENPIYCLEDHERKTIPLDQGDYKILVFNDYLYSKSQNFLKNIIYTGTEDFETFEAHATTIPNTAAFRARASDVVVNNPDTLSTQSTMNLSIIGQQTHQLKYQNGVGGFDTNPNYLEDSLLFIPCRVVHNCVIYVHAINVKALNGIGKAKATIRGFAGSALLASRLPGHSNVTHQVNLNNMLLDQGSTSDGTITGSFSTFGPPLDLPDRTYELEINILFPSGRATQFIVDVTNQLTPQIAQMNKDRLANKPIMDDIIIRAEIALDNDQGDWDVDLDDWGDDIIITIPWK